MAKGKKSKLVKRWVFLDKEIRFKFFKNKFLKVEKKGLCEVLEILLVKIGVMCESQD